MTRLRVFALCVVVWSVALLVPVPSKPFADTGITVPDLKFYVSKLIHVAGYAFLTAFVAFLPISRAKRLGLVLFLSLHGALSEAFQWWFTSYRSSSLRDVGLDHLGILIGLLATWNRWRVVPPEHRPAEPNLAPVEQR